MYIFGYLILFHYYIPDSGIEYSSPCEPSPCGLNAECVERNGAGSCKCLEDFIGNPYEGCRPECVVNTDCSPTLACIQNKCKDPCPGICAPNGICQVVNHLPSCHCPMGLTGDAYTYCIDKVEGKHICFSFILNKVFIPNTLNDLNNFFRLCKNNAMQSLTLRS